MSSAYSCIITKEKITIPERVPHFNNNDVITIPIDVSNYAIEEFIEFFGIRKNPLSMVAEDFYDSLEYRPIPEDDIFKVLEIINELNLREKSFLLYHESDWADIPDHHTEAAFSGGKLIDDGYFMMQNIEEEIGIYGNAFAKLGIPEGYIYIDRGYGEAVIAYVESIFKPGLWRSL